jgi:hypothetical protein
MLAATGLLTLTIIRPDTRAPVESAIKTIAMVAIALAVGWYHPLLFAVACAAFTAGFSCGRQPC